MNKKEEQRITIGELKKHLSAYSDDDKLYFGGLEFYRLKDRGSYIQVEFSETVGTDENGEVVIFTQRD